MINNRILEKFQYKFDIVLSPNKNSYMKNFDNNCWIWNGSSDRDGYGMIQDCGKTKMAHRIGWEIYNGPIPKGLLVCHHCDIPSCVNPNHLFLETNKDNSNDMVKKRRSRKGDKCSRRMYPELYPVGDDHWTRKFPEKIKKLAEGHRGEKRIGNYAKGDEHGLRKHPEIAKRIGKINKEKMKNNEYNAKSFIVINPNGKEFKIKNITKFCKTKNLNCQCMAYVAQGKQKQHKGWKCKYLQSNKK